MFRRALDAELRKRCADGVANKTKKEDKEAITAEEKKTLWEKNLLGCHSANHYRSQFIFTTGCCLVSEGRSTEI